MPSTSSCNGKQKIEVSLRNWILGGPLVSVTSTRAGTSKRFEAKNRPKTLHQVIMSDINSDDNKIMAFRTVNKVDQERPSDGNKELDHEKAEKKDSINHKGNVREVTETYAGMIDKKIDNKEKTAESKQNIKAITEKHDKHCDRCSEHLKNEEKYSKNEFEKREKGKDESEGDNYKEPDSKNNNQEFKTKRVNIDEISNRWSEAQDNKIKAMKAANKSWKEICSEVEAGKKEVQDRYKELIKEEPTTSNKTKQVSFGDATYFSHLFDETEVEQAEVMPGGSTGGMGENKGAPRSANNVVGHSISNSHSQREAKEIDNKDQRATPDCNITYSHPRPMQDGNSNPKLQPDSIWSESDCEVLERLVRNYDEHKWLHVQAAFFNWTGRMISAGLLKQKCVDDGI